MWRRSVVLVACAVAVGMLLSCGTDEPSSPREPTKTATPTRTPTPTKTPTSTPTSTPTDGPASDARQLDTLLFPGTPSCPGSDVTDRTCGDLLAASADSVDTVEAALKDMPKTGPYRKVTKAVNRFQRTYKLIKRLGCYAGKPVRDREGLLCQTFADVLPLEYLNLQSKIAGLDQ